MNPPGYLRPGGWLTLLALAVVLCWAPPGRAEVRYRLHPSLRVGAGWGTDLFLGANLGPSFQGTLTPALEVDLSLLPRLKLFGSYECELGLYQATAGTSVDNELTLGTRIRLAKGLWAQVSVQGEAQDLSVSQGVDDVVGVQASRTLGAVGSPGLRWFVGDYLLELFGHFGTRHLVLDGGEAIDDRSLAGVFSVGRGLGPVWLTLLLRAVTERSGEDSLSYDGGSASLVAGAVLGQRVTLRLSGAVHRNAFALGRADWLVRASLAPSVRVVKGVWLEASYGYAANFSNAAAYDADRHFVSLGVRVEGEWQN